jgi:hypothetical protein
MRWTFDYVADQGEESAVAEQKAAMKKATQMYPAADFEFGASSWGWPQMPICSQQLVRQDKFDPEQACFPRGAHMPLMVFIGEKGRTRRSAEGRGRRTEKQEAMGWPRARIEALKRGETWSNRGSGASSWSGRFKPAPWGEPARNRGGEPARNNPPRAGGPSSSSSWSWEDPSQTAWQDSTGWGTDWSSKVNWGWKQ